MSRVIKFRCWNAFSNHMHEWSEMIEKNKIHLLSNENKSYTCEQFTGLTDKNGVEIYEGDIIPYYGKNYQVVMVGACWTLDEYEEIDYYNDDAPERQDWPTFEVIGNIHQHSHLLDSN